MNRATTFRFTPTDRDLIRRLQIKTTLACAEQSDFRPPSQTDILRMGLRLLMAEATKGNGADALRWAHMVMAEDVNGDES